MEIIKNNNLDLENQDYRQSENNNLHFHKGLLNTEPYEIHVCVIYSLLNYIRGLEYLVPEDVNVKSLENMCKEHCLNLIKVLKIPSSFFEKRHFHCLENVHNEDLTITARQRTNSILSIRTSSNLLSPYNKFNKLEPPQCKDLHQPYSVEDSPPGPIPFH